MNAQPPKSYDRVVKTIHWTSLVLVAAAYTIVWLAGAAATKEAKTALLTLHRSIGLTIFAVTLFRIAWYARAAVPSLPADMSRVQKFAAHATQTLLGALLLAQPVLGLVHSNARGVRVNFYFLGQLPAIVGADPSLAKLAHTAHGAVANLLLMLIGLHAAAALFHHFIRRDDVLKAMLPQRRPRQAVQRPPAFRAPSWRS
jgi:cytochrome b561